MAAFTVWKFDDLDGADHAESVLEDCQAEGFLKVIDHAVVTWPPGDPHPKTSHGNDDKWRGTGWGALWGVLVGALFFVPVVGGVVGAAIGAISKMTEDAGITKEQLETIRTELTPGTSALFVVTENGDLDRVGERLRGIHSKLITTNLTEGERQMLLETFGGR
ncbi:DUF1269 domain-containing protein [Terrabacter sp. Ter38]|uniref:DUF1269 domain-containing protein n=1 Tax=Terrabacter sp. Ter38 TaxID=2926030 RepID=UPI002118125E|nr:DUF1269 domain-containing protein [Terrabacter sp. Ter38]